MRQNLNEMKNLFLKMMAAAAVLGGCSSTKAVSDDNGMVIGAYVMGVRNELPDVDLVTHVNFAFGHVNETFDGVLLPDSTGLRQIAGLKAQKPALKVLLSVGGWGSGRFSEMAADSLKRKSFSEDCGKIVEKYGIDGIDIDWEYPGSDMAGISASPDDKGNFTLLMRDLRTALGTGRLLTLASVCNAEYIDFKAILPYVDYVNVMSYDMGYDGTHHAALYRSEHAGYCTADEAVRKHIAAGVPPTMIVMGMPFYGRSTGGGYTAYSEKRPEGIEFWDDTAKVPMVLDSEGVMLLGYENEKSISEKCRYIVDHGLRGGMYWEYNVDNASHDLASTVHDGLAGASPMKHVLVVAEGGGHHKAFTDVAVPWLDSAAREKGIAVSEIRNMNNVTARFLDSFDAFVQLDFPPYTWPEEAEDAFISYIEDGKGGYVGFHHATLIGEFDGWPMWKWFSDFMGGIRFKSYVADLAAGDVHVEDAEHPVMSGVSKSFTIPDDEWYTYDVNPRNADYIHVLAAVDENSYSPMTEVKMGDHPVIWTNTSVKARNVYFQFGHSPKLLDNADFRTLLLNSVNWAAGNDK